VGFRVTNRQVGWAVFIALAGSFVGGDVGLAPGIIIGGVWGGAIGYGIGLLLDQKRPTRWILMYWSATLGLFGAPPALLIAGISKPYLSDGGEMLAGVTGFIIGALIGLLAGTLHWWRLRRNAGITS
jgi:hypothetical protein